jgi:DNA-binding MarR family transcriptional regulator
MPDTARNRQDQIETGEAQAGPGFERATFFPYITRVFYTHVTRAVSDVYVSRYDMKPAEWRTMAILGADKALTAAQIVELSSMDKVSVSRAVTRLRGRGWLDEAANPADARSRILQLSEEGCNVYFDLVPRLLSVEEALLADLDDAEIEQMKRLMSKIQAASDKLSE